VDTVEQTTSAIVDDEKKQSDLIGELKDELDKNDAATERAMREKAEQNFRSSKRSSY